MNSIENLHYAIGQLAFAVAFADGNLQKEEHECFHDIVVQELKNEDHSFDVSDIVFQILEKDKIDTETVYEWAMKEIRMNSHYLSPELKNKFISVMEKVAKAYPPVTHEEAHVIDRFKNDIEKIYGDPVFYQTK